MDLVPPPQADAARSLATLLHLMRRAREAASEEVLGFVMVNETLNLLPYRQAALWRGGALGRVMAVSGLPETDPNAPYVQWLTGLCRTVGTGESVRCLTSVDVPAEVAADWPAWLPTYLLYLTLTPPAGNANGALLLARDEPWTEYERTLAMELVDAYAHAQGQFAPQRGWRDRLGLTWQSAKARRWIVLALLTLACFPVRLTVLARGEITPQTPLLMRAPLGGVIDRITVQPNQQVEAGTPLFSLDATTLAGQSALASKASEAAQESFRQRAQLALTDDRAKLQMAEDQAKLEEKRIEAEFTSRQLARIQVKAPKAGVVVFSDSSDWLGKAVSAGERVMQLADPAKVELTAFVPVAESIPIEPGSTVRLYPNAAPTESFDAVVTRLAYRAEVTEEGILAYRLYARLSDTRSLPRIGQMGTVRVYGDWVPLSYYALRRPLTWLRQWLGW
ncbi:HlyD family efflux transporter periplasmic adaptor subunit [Chitinivorax sp. B]|uniref:efflux RND transporter periplasmic adaptor subunit n=1 Tax=Chitinivorax sp. B TaxID=2502235 RepID=UPI0010F9EE79|nr:HlyD family efflux transporter periplasmic adaptor subunit [Chitinivorax sp. B]